MKAKLSGGRVLVEVVLLCVGLSCAGMAAAGADTPAEISGVRSAPVRYGDLDLNRPADARKLYSRIRLAARHVCGNPDIRNLADVARSQPCLEQAVDDAVARVNSPELTAIHYNSQRLARR